jgi:hypothetical protein
MWAGILTRRSMDWKDFHTPTLWANFNLIVPHAGFNNITIYFIGIACPIAFFEL